MTKYQIKPIPGFKGYFIDTNSDAWSVKNKEGKKRKLKSYTCLYVGYNYVNLYKNGKAHKSRIHRLMLETFISKCPKGMEACHNNGVRTDNRVENLRWSTRKDNCTDKIKHGTLYCGEKHYQSKLTELQVQTIRFIYKTGKIRQWQLARAFGVNQQRISAIIKFKSWKHI